MVDTLTRPREIAHLIRNKAFGSADNISHHHHNYSPAGTKDEHNDKERRAHYGSASLPREGSISGSTQSNREMSFDGKIHKYSSDDGHASGPRSISRKICCYNYENILVFLKIYYYKNIILISTHIGIFSQKL